MGRKAKESPPLPLVALVLAWVIPGAGHVYIGRVARGVIIFVTIAATFWGGVAMGGVMTVDYGNERWWFVAEMLTGTHGLVSWGRSRAVYRRLNARLDERIRNDENLSRQFRGVDWPDRTSGGATAAAQLLREQYIAQMLADDTERLALVAPAATPARAYAGVAGLLNLMCIFDAVLLALMGGVGEPKRAPPPAGGKEQRQPKDR